jgi:hypothetical protein
LFQSAAGSLVFNSGQRLAFITVVILSANSTQGERSFEVRLANPAGGAGIGVGSSISVVIQPTAQAFGTFQFADNSQAITLSFDDGTSTIQAQFIVCNNHL